MVRNSELREAGGLPFTSTGRATHEPRFLVRWPHMLQVLVSYLRILVALLIGLALWLCAGSSVAAAPWRITPKPSWAMRLDSAASSPPLQANARRGRRLLLLHTHVRFVGHEVHSFSQHVRRVENDSGVQDASMVSWSVDSSFEALQLHRAVIRRGDRQIDQLRTANVRVSGGNGTVAGKLFDSIQTVSLVLEDIRVGDVLEVEYTIISRDSTLLGRISSVSSLGLVEPIDRLGLRISLPQGRPIQWKVQSPRDYGLSLEPEKSSTPEGGDLVWDLRNVPAHEPEDRTPGWYSHIPYVEISEFPTWRSVIEWGLQLYGIAAEPTPDVKAEALALTRDQVSIYEKVLTLIRFVQDQVRYVGMEIGPGRRKPAPASQTLKRRHGDCKDKSVLLSAMLRSIGVPAWPALVNTGMGAGLPAHLPSASRFDHVIVRIKVDEKDYWVDPTASLEGGELDQRTSLPYHHALVLSNGSNDLEALRETQPSELTIHETWHVHLPADPLPTEMEFDREFRRGMADDFRARATTESATEIDKSFRELYAQLFPRIEQVAPVEHHDDRSLNIVRVKGRYRIPGFWEEQSKAAWQATLTSSLMIELLKHPGTGPRKAPLQLLHPVKARHTLTVETPEDWDAGPYPDLNESTACFSFTRTSAYESRRLNIDWQYQSHRSWVEAADLGGHASSIERSLTQTAQSLTWRLPDPARNWPAVVGTALLSVGMAYAAFRAWRWKPSAAAKEPAETPRRASASLGLVLLGIRCLFTPVTMASGLRVYAWMFTKGRWDAALESMGSFELAYAVLVWGELAAGLGLVFWSAVILALFFRRRVSFPVQFVWFTVAALALQITDQLLLTVFPKGTIAGPGLDARAITGMIIGIAFILYVRSPPLKARFTRP